MTDWNERAKEDFFKYLSTEERERDIINCDKVSCRNSTIAKGQRGIFARCDIKRGEIIEWGIVTRIPGVDVRKGDVLYSWSSTDRSLAAATSGCALYYNTMGDDSNARCVPYHSEDRFEIYAMRDIAMDDEITIRYDSMNYRETMKPLLGIVGELKNGDKV